MPESEIQSRADSQDDGLAQYVLAQRLLQTIITGLGRGEIRPESIPDETVDTIRMYFVEAIRKHIRGNGPYNLAWLSYALGDKTGAAAWLTIDQRMEGSGFGQFRKNALTRPDGFYVLGQNDLTEGATRAKQLIDDYDLSDSLSEPGECL